MCDMTQFVDVVPVLDEISVTLAEYFMQNVLFKIGICHLLILDDDNSFKCAFIGMCESLNINYDVLAKRNHKDLLVEKFHRFLIKTITIVAEGRGTNDNFIAVGVAVGYNWNSSPIDGTDIFRSIPAICRELRFPFDIDLSDLPSLVSNNAESVVFYLRITGSNRSFASTILKILVEDRRITHAEIVDDSRNIVTMQSGDIVMARSAILNNKAIDKVAKL